MNLYRPVLLFLKGCCMGAADVIPGVSGGTIALIVGIYRELIHTLRNLHLRWVRPAANLLLLTNPADAFKELKDELRSMNVSFLAPLMLGIMAAIAGGSAFIPTLLADYPIAVKSLFFGLILASVWIPFRIVDSMSLSALPAVLVVGIALTLVGFYVSNPGLRITGSMQWITVESSGETLAELLESVPSARPAHRVYWNSRNQEFRNQLHRRESELANRLQTLRDRRVEKLSPKEAIKARSEPYEKITVPEGFTVKIPRLSYWYVFAIGALAITAMILPGISGSYILLILGAYFFVLNSVHGFLSGLLGGQLLLRQGTILLLFSLGAGVGLLVFTRVLDYLLNHWQKLTAAGLSGLMLGCLRGVWPFSRTIGGTVTLIVPDHFTSAVRISLLMGAAGMGLVLLLSFLPSADAPSQPHTNG